MTNDSLPPEPGSSPFHPGTRAEIVCRFGEPMAEVVGGAVTRALRGVAADAEAAGLEPETAVAGFLHVCRELCDGIQRRRDGSGDDGLN